MEQVTIEQRRAALDELALAADDMARIKERSDRYHALADQLDSGCLPGLDSRTTASALGLAASLTAADMPNMLALVATLAEDLKQIKDAGVHPGLVRWCAWPDCWRSFVAMDSRPELSSASWIRLNKTGQTMCPTHSAAQHWLDFEKQTDPVGWAAKCQCGEQQRLGAVSLGRILEWWRDHIRSLASERT